MVLALTRSVGTIPKAIIIFERLAAASGIFDLTNRRARRVLWTN